jgi:hypothetical protein
MTFYIRDLISKNTNHSAIPAEANIFFLESEFEKFSDYFNQNLTDIYDEKKYGKLLNLL